MAGRISSDPEAAIVAVVSADCAFRDAVAEALRLEGRQVVVGDDQSCLLDIQGWTTEWRGLDTVEAVIIDLGEDVALGLDALDAVRRRDPTTFVIVLSRARARRGKRRLGAHLILDGDVHPTAVVAALKNRKRREIIR